MRAPSQIGLEFRSVCVGRDRDADLNVVCGAAGRVGRTAGLAIAANAPSQFKLALCFDQIFNAGVGVRLNHCFDPNEGAHGGRKPIRHAQ